MRVLFAEMPWRGKAYAGRAGMRWAYTSDKKPLLSFRPFPFYIGCSAAILLKDGHDVKVIDALAENLTDTEFFTKVIEFKPDFIVAETSTPSYNNDRQIAKEIKEKVNAKIVFCGQHATALPEDVITENKGIIDHVLVGEYEFLIKKLVDGETTEKIIKLQKAPEIDSIPWPARELFKMELYNETFCDQYPNIQMMASRGCYHSCSYCNIYLMCGSRKPRFRDPKDVVKELKFCIEKYKPKNIWFEDDMINCDPVKFEELCDIMITEKINVPFYAMGHCAISEKLLEKMAKAGCKGMKFGVESADNDVLLKLGKGLTVELVEKTVNKCKELGIKTHLTYAIGLPGDTEETVKKTIKFALSHGDQYQISLAIPFPGTPLYAEAKSKGWLKARAWEEFDGMYGAVIDYPNLSKEKLYELYQLGQKATYWKAVSSGQWKKYLRMIYQENGIKGIANLVFIRGPGMLKSALQSKFKLGLS